MESPALPDISIRVAFHSDILAIERARVVGSTPVQLTSDRTRGDAQRCNERLGFRPSHVGMKRSLA